jgi:hypothetical protein
MQGRLVFAVASSVSAPMPPGGTPSVAHPRPGPTPGTRTVREGRPAPSGDGPCVVEGYVYEQLTADASSIATLTEEGA